MNKYEHNPILTKYDITPSKPNFEVVGVFNAGTAVFDGEYILALRVAERPIMENATTVLTPVYDAIKSEINIISLDNRTNRYDLSDPRVIRDMRKDEPAQDYLTSISHIRLARSHDGVHFAVDTAPFIHASDSYTSFGIEDPRVTKLRDWYYISYSAASSLGIVTGLVRTRDFRTNESLGIIFPPDNKDVAIFPEKINGLYYALHRPSSSEYGKPEIWIASSPDLLHWGNHRLLANVRENKWDCERIGAGCVPILTKDGWLEIYHGATKDNRYCLGLLLLSKNEPWHVLARSELPVLEPKAPYETKGFFGNVVFTCGAIVNADSIRVYYGSADDSVCFAETTISALLNAL